VACTDKLKFEFMSATPSELSRLAPLTTAGSSAGVSATLLSSGRWAAFSKTGDFALLSEPELVALQDPSGKLSGLPHEKVAELYAKHFLHGPTSSGMNRLLSSRRAARRETIESGASLHVFVPTLQCEHTCQYCQVSRSLSALNVSLSNEQIDAACASVFESPSATLTVEFQGGDPLLRFDLVRRAIEHISARNIRECRRVQFVVASTLHQLDGGMCDLFREHSVVLSTSIDGPATLHNRNRPLPSRDAHERTVRGIELARERIAPRCVSALMTTTRASLPMAEAIVDEYVRLGFDEIFIRPLSPYGFARRNDDLLGYTTEAFRDFYLRCIERILWWNRQGFQLRETSAAVWLNKLLSPFDAGYVDLQSPTGAGSAAVVYNYDGWVYPSDEARMLAETGDKSLRLGKIGEPLPDLIASPVVESLRRASDGESHPECAACPYNMHCGPDPVADHGMAVRSLVSLTEHCKRSKWMFLEMLEIFDRAGSSEDEFLLDLLYAWAIRKHPRRLDNVAATLTLPDNRRSAAQRPTPRLIPIVHERPPA
jgi:His-Xaa-Ser system radical SAM maturase HxsB